MQQFCFPIGGHFVALLTEGVDRNKTLNQSAGSGRKVALLTEGVDRNVWDNMVFDKDNCHPPRGGRG